MALIDDFLPSYQFSERHSCCVEAPPTAIVDTVSTYRPDLDPVFKIAIVLRELPMRLLLRNGDLPAPLGFQNFSLLGRRDDEIVYGLVGQFWKSDYGLRPIAAGEGFVAFGEEHVAKLGFSAVPKDGAVSVLATETRVFCPSPATRLKFLTYWLLIRPVSGLIRRRILSAIKMETERAYRISMV